MSVNRTFKSLRRAPLRWVMAVVIVASIVGVGQVAVAVTEADLKAASSAAREATRELAKHEDMVAKLERKAEDEAKDKAAADAELAHARAVVAGKEEPETGLLGGLFGPKDPQERLARARSKATAAAASLTAANQELANARRELSTSQSAAKAAVGKRDAIDQQLHAAEAAEAAKIAAKERALNDWRAAHSNNARSEATLEQLRKKVNNLQSKEKALQQEKIEAMALVRAATEVATHAEEASERRSAVREMRKAESSAADASRDLDRTSYELKQTVKELETAELAASQTRAELQRALAEYEPYAAKERAAAAAAANAEAMEKAAEEKARQAKIAEKQRLADERAAAKAAAQKAQQEAVAATNKQPIAPKPMPSVKPAPPAVASGGAVAARQAEVEAERRRQQAAIRNAQMKAEKEAGALAAKPLSEREAALAAERRQQEAAIQKAMAEQAALDAKAAEMRDEAEAEAQAAKEKARLERDADKIAAIEAERAERARQRELAANKVTFEGPVDPIAEGASARATENGSAMYDVCAVVVTGDREAVYELENWSDYENDALYQPMSDKDIESFRLRILKDLQDSGYVFATVSIFKPSLNLGFLKLRAHVGQQGEVTVKGNRWNSAKQILEAASWQTGSRFNYRELYADVFDLNVRPDMKVNTKLKPRMDEYGNRIVDVEIDVEDRWPVHGSLNLSNTGSSETSDWRLRTTLQHLNLTQNDDILSLEWLTDPAAMDEVNAASTSYHLPLTDNRSLTLYGGWSESDIDDVLPLLDVYGRGYYFGFQYTTQLLETKKRNYDMTLGWLFQHNQSGNDLGGTAFETYDADLSMPQIGFGFSDKAFDSLGGRNFFSHTLIANFDGTLGSSNQLANSTTGPTSDGSFVINRFQLARYQRFFAGEEAPGKWSLFLKLDGQVTRDSLVPAMQKGIGGTDSVRGHDEREVLGDYGFNTTVELRTPLLDNFIPGLKRDPDFLSENPDYWSNHRMQFVFFGDYGWVAPNDVQPGENDKGESLASVGAGVRLGLTKYSQLRLDYGLPLDTSRESDSSGRGHLSLQVQF